MSEKEKSNLKVLRSIRIGGKHVEAGSVIAKSAFDSRADWYDLCTMSPPKLSETDEKIGAEKAAMPGAK